MFARVFGGFWRWFPLSLLLLLVILSVAVTLAVVVRLGREAHRPALGVGIAAVVVAIEGTYRFGDVMAWIGD